MMKVIGMMVSPFPISHRDGAISRQRDDLHLGAEECRLDLRRVAPRGALHPSQDRSGRAAGSRHWMLGRAEVQRPRTHRRVARSAQAEVGPVARVRSFVGGRESEPAARAPLRRPSALPAPQAAAGVNVDGRVELRV